jgi:putative DNA primase/helicase
MSLVLTYAAISLSLRLNVGQTVMNRTLEQAMRSAGIEPPAEIIADGKLHRFHVEGDRPGSKNGWYVLHDSDPAAGAFGCWKRGISETWCSKEYRHLTPEEKTLYDARIELMRKRHEEEQARVHAECRAWCADTWKKAEKASNGHPYLKSKGVNSYGLKIYEDTLMVAVQDMSGTLHGIQFIAGDGFKKFKTGTKKAGHLFEIGKSKDNTVIICEGYTTGASIHQATGCTVVIAFDAGNLLPVAKTLRAKYPDMKIIIAADNDQWTNGNPGLIKAAEAARETGAVLAVPEFQDLATKPTDFNDLHRLEGIEVVRRCIQAATKNTKKTALSLVKTANDLIATSQETDWLVYEMFSRKSISIIGGAQKESKTFFALEIATALSCGRAVFGAFPAQCGKVLFLEGDVPSELIKWRLQNCGYKFRSDNFFSLNKFDLLQNGVHLDLSTSGGQRAFDDLLTNIEPDLVTIDSISAFHSIDEKDATEIKPVILFLTYMASKHNAHIILVHHSRKRKKTEEKMDITMDDLIGSNVPMRFSSTVYGVQKRKDVVTGDLQYRLTTLGSWFRPIDPVILKIFEVEGSEEGKLILEWSTAEVLPKNKIEYAMFAIEKLLANGPAKHGAIIAALPTVHSRTTERALARLIEHGKIQRRGIERGGDTFYEPIKMVKSVGDRIQSHTGSHSSSPTTPPTSEANLSEAVDAHPAGASDLSDNMSETKTSGPQEVTPDSDKAPSLQEPPKTPLTADTAIDLEALGAKI